MTPSSFRTKIVDRAKFSCFFANTFIRIVKDENINLIIGFSVFNFSICNSGGRLSILAANKKF
jgi:hypothetical protein